MHTGRECRSESSEIWNGSAKRSLLPDDASACMRADLRWLRPISPLYTPARGAEAHSTASASAEAGTWLSNSRSALRWRRERFSSLKNVGADSSCRAGEPAACDGVRCRPSRPEAAASRRAVECIVERPTDTDGQTERAATCADGRPLAERMSVCGVPACAAECVPRRDEDRRSKSRISALWRDAEDRCAAVCDTRFEGSRRNGDAGETGAD